MWRSVSGWVALRIESEIPCDSCLQFVKSYVKVVAALLLELFGNEN